MANPLAGSRADRGRLPGQSSAHRHWCLELVALLVGRMTRVGRIKGLAVTAGALGLALTARADGLRDPMRPPLPQTHVAIPTEPAPVLTAVLTFHGERTAIFNGCLV